MTSIIFTAILIVFFTIIIICLLLKIHELNKKNKYVDEANMWHRLAITDSLTGLYNRYAYDNQIKKIREKKLQNPYGILIFDIDDFKKINDTNGHLVGDKVLQIVSENLLKVFSEPGYKVFRIGGDEISVISEGVSEKEIIKKLLILREQVENKHNIYLSKGYSIVCGDIDEAVKNADEMLYADKLNKKERTHY